MFSRRSENGERWSTTNARVALACGSWILGLLQASACSEKSATTETYFDRTISPILQNSCVSTNTGANCHVADAKGNAFGNLSLRSYTDLIKRRDLLVNYGPYGQPDFLLKNIEPFQINLTTYDGSLVSITTDIRHAGGTILGVSTAGFGTIKRWIADGANENNAVSPPPVTNRDGCATEYPSDPAFAPNTEPTTPDYAEFKANVQPILGGTCAAGNCHGAASNSLRFVCATDPSGSQTETFARWNYFAATQYLAAGSNLATSELVRRPLDPSQGGAYHEGGVIFPSPSDASYQAMLAWANSHGPNTNFPTSKGFEFFGKRVEPMLVKKGCMILGCHSPAMFHDYRLRGGGNGSFSAPTTKTNYELTLNQIALESPDPGASRIIAKNLLRPDEITGGRGILHRGGALLADFAGGVPTVADCGPLTDADTSDLDQSHAYCILARWIQIEQQERALAPLSGVVYVKRPPAPRPDTAQDFASYAPGADLCFTGIGMNAQGAITAPAGSCKSLLAGCAGLTVSAADVRHPSVSWKGDTVAFAARAAAGEPFSIWTVKTDGSACAKNAEIATPAVDDTGAPVPPNGALVQDFDPAFAPDGRLVFASTRGNVMNTAAFDYQGPQRTPADPSRWNANLYVLESGKVRQLTFLLNQEMLPSFMSDGRLIFTTEKRTPGFYELAGRRMNLDGGDYHPLFSQRRTVGYAQLTEVVELANKNFAAIFSDQSAVHGAGTLGIFNRSLGTDLYSADPADYPADPGAIAWPEYEFYLHSLHFPDAAASGHVGGGGTGVYRSPSALPNGNLLVSYAAGVSDVGAFDGNFDVWVMDEISGARLLQVTNDPAADELSAVAVYERAADRGVFTSRYDEPNAHTRVYAAGQDFEHPADRAEVTILDTGVLGSLLFQNSRTGRPIPQLSDGLGVFEDLPPQLSETSFAAATPAFVASDAYGQVYARRRSLGRAHPFGDGSAYLQVPGGVPLVLSGNFQLDGEATPALHFQREEMQFYPGEYSNQSFPRQFFNGLCAGCHGSLSGKELDISIRPDVLTQASQQVTALQLVGGKRPPPDLLAGPPASRGPEQGPPF